MKKILFLALAFVLIIPIISYAASISGAETILSSTDPARIEGLLSPQRFSLSIDNDFITDKELKVSAWSKDAIYSIMLPPAMGGFWMTQTFIPQMSIYTKTKIDRLYRTTAKISYAVFKNLDIFVKLGRANLKLKDESFSGTAFGIFTIPALGMTIPTRTNIDNGDLDYDIDNAFVWGIGFKATYDLPKDWLIGIDAQYLRHKNDYDASSLIATTTIGVNPPQDTLYESWKGTLTVYEWQIAPYIAKKIKNFIPYVGVKYSDLRIKDESQTGVNYISSLRLGGPVADISIDSYLKKYKAKHNVGPFIGLDYNIGKHWKINLEGRFVDETAMSCNISYKF